MATSFRTLAIGTVVVGILIGAAFGAGAAFGGGDDPEASAEGLTSAQIQQLYGAPTGGTGAAGASGPAAARAAGAPSNSALGGASLGRITAVEGQTITVETAQGSVKLNLTESTIVSKVENGGRSDLAVGDVVAASGPKKDDGSVDATSVSEVPAELQNLAGGTTTPTTP